MEQDLPDATPLMDADDIERALLGRPASMRHSEISQDVEVTPGSARRFWHALGFQIVEDEEAMFTEADREALQAVARLTHDLDVEEELALAMTRALARCLARHADIPVAALGREPGPVVRVRARLEADPSVEHSLADLAAIAGLTPHRLIRAFRRETGLTPHAYLVDRRVADPGGGRQIVD